MRHASNVQHLLHHARRFREQGIDLPDHLLTNLRDAGIDPNDL